MTFFFQWSLGICVCKTKCLALWLQCNDYTWEAQTGAFVNQTMLPVLSVLWSSEAFCVDGKRWFFVCSTTLTASSHPNCSSIYSKQTTLARLNRYCVVSIHVEVTKSIYAKMLQIITLRVSTTFQGIACKEAQFVTVCWGDSAWLCFFVYR